MHFTRFIFITHIDLRKSRKEIENTLMDFWGEAIEAVKLASEKKVADERDFTTILIQFDLAWEKAFRPLCSIVQQESDAWS